LLNAPEFPLGKSVVLPDPYRPARTVQIKNRLVPLTDHVDVWRTVIVRINHHPHPAKSQNRRHKNIVSYFLSAGVIPEIGF
jgi:hypothetical protein